MLEDPHLRRLGTLIDGKLQLVRLLGTGGMGAVYSATHLKLGQTVAVKLLTGPHIGSAEVVARFVREARVASALVSEHVVRVFDLGQTESGEPYIVMELLEGEDLAQLLEREGPLPVARAVGLVLQGCLGVAAAHASGLVHRDIKPANLFLVRRPGGREVVKVLDFGLSKIVDPANPSLTASSAALGTPMYMAPEQILSSKHVDARCDQHALAMVLYELLVGDPPYLGEAAGELMVRIATSPPPSARAVSPGVPARLDDALRRALGKTPDARFPDLAAFAGAIAPWASPADAALVAEVAATLASGAPRGPAAQYGAIVDASTVPLERDRADSHGGLTSSMHRRRRGRGAAGLVAAAVVVGGAIALLTLGSPSPPATERADAEGSSTAHAAAPPDGSAVADVDPVDAAPRSSLETPDAVPAASASGTATTSAKVRHVPRPKPSAKPIAAPTARSTDPTEVFGDRKKP